jgi:hypothetical protein
MLGVVRLTDAFETLTGRRGRSYDERELDVFETVKTISFGMGITAYTTQYQIAGSTNNPWEVLNFPTFFNFIVMGSVIVLELFFAISAFMYSYRILKLAEVKSITFWDCMKIWMRKVIRLAPVVWVVFFIFWSFMPRLNSGPVWQETEMLFASCRTDWWTKLLLIGNIIPFDQPPTYGCFYWDYMIAIDIQLALITPLLVLPFLKSKYFGFAVCGITILLGMAVQSYLTYKWDYKIGWMASQNYTFMGRMIYKPWNHLAPWATGVIAAYVYMRLLDFRRF